MDELKGLAMSGRYDGPSSSMTPTSGISQTSHFALPITSSALPSLDNTSPSHPESSIQISAAGPFLDAQVRRMTEDGELTSLYKCYFGFLGCPESYHDQSEWLNHCDVHFRGHRPPRNVKCPFICEWCPEPGLSAWSERQLHVAKHLEQGWMLEKASPDHGLFRYLWNIKVLDDAQFQELTRNGRLAASSEAYTVTQSRGLDRRRERALKM